MLHMSSNDDDNKVDPEDNACSSLKAALKACGESNHLKVEREFTRFITLLKEYKVSEPLPCIKKKQKSCKINESQTHAESAQAHKTYPTDTIPLDLIALLGCLNNHGLAEYADNAIGTVIDLIAEDDRLSFLRQNIYQEVAGYFTRRGKYLEADELLLQQLSIVSLKGSKVLHDFVRINRLINLGNMHISNLKFDDAKTSFLEALLLIETSPEKHPDQIAFLYEGWTKLDDLSTAQTS
jgi:hypothetical protein